MKEFYKQTAQEALQTLHADAAGLDGPDAARRLEQYGPNQLAEGKKKSVAQVFFEQFKDLLVAILMAAALISLASGQGESTLVIFAVLLLNAVLGTVQYLKAEKSLESLKAMSAPSAKVLRDGETVQLAAAQVVPGDVVLLEAGDLVVADGRLLENWSLKVNESSLTGESEAVEKTTQPLDGGEVALGDQKNMVFSGSLVTYGRAMMVVTATGMETQIGRIAALMNRTQQRKTPLQQSLDTFSRKLAMVILAICVGVFLLSVVRSGMPVLDSLMFAVALAVAAIPEALSSIVTIVLAMGTQKMARQNAVIKDLKAVESLGAVSVICSDKTGTLTQNRMQVQKAYVAGQLLEADALDAADAAQGLLLRMGLLASDATIGQEGAIGDPTEIALVQLGRQYGLNEHTLRAECPRLAELAFDSDRKLMSTLHQLDGSLTLFTKGAIDTLLDRADQVLTAEGARPITPQDKQRLLDANGAFSAQGLRVLTFAQRTLPQGHALTLADEEHFTLVGLVAMMDPPRPESVEAVASARKAGIRTIMITGDHKVTASAIAAQIGIMQPGDEAVDGPQLQAMTDAQLDEALPRIAVYARVSPEHKIRIVEAWQRRGNIVSMTGDGVNDAPALKRADIGVAMGITGTEVSKDAASMILTDDNFATIVKAVTNGRGVYANIKNAIQFLLSGNTAGILCVLYASLAGLPVPFAPVHLLFINLLTDSLPAIAIGMEPAGDDLLNDPPRDPRKPLLDRPLLGSIGLQGALIGVAAMAAFYLGLAAGGAALASTMAFATLTLARLFHGFNCRGKASIFKLGFASNWYSLAAFGLGAVLLAAVLFIPGLSGLFAVSALSAVQLGQILLLAFAPTALIQLYKALRR